MRTACIRFAASIVLLLSASLCFAQGVPTAKLSGRVTNDGAALPGATVTVSSPNLQGERTTVTATGGEFLFASLPPGTYTLRVSLEGMATVEREVQLAATQLQTLDVAMNVAALEETIQVTGEAAVISESAQVATTIPKALVDRLPVGRSLNEIVTLSPGVHATGPNKNVDTGVGAITISGASSAENLFLVNGVAVNENLRGQALDLFIEDAIQETTTASASMSAEYGRFSGGVVNVVTKSGGNDFHGSVRDTLFNQDWQGKTPLTVQQTDEVIPTYEATLGGRVLRDRLWFFLAGRGFDQAISKQTNVTNLSYVSGPDQKRYEGKLTGTLNESHTLIGSYGKIEQTDRGNSFGNILDLASVYDRKTPQDLWSLNYSGVLSSNLVVTGQYSRRKFTFENSGAPSTDLIGGTLLIDRPSGRRYHAPTFCGICGVEKRNNENYLAKLSYFVPTTSAGAHELSAGIDSYNDIREANNHQSGSDYRILGTGVILRGTDVFPIFLPGTSTLIQYNPIAKSSLGTDFRTNSAYVNDTWRLGERWSFNLGLRYDKNDGKDSEGKSVAKDSAFSPRLAASFDIKGDGDMVARVGYARYVAALANSVADGTSAAGNPATFQWTYGGPAINADPNAATLVDQNAALQTLFNWFNSIGGINDRTRLVTAVIPGGNTVIRGSLDSPSAIEYTLGLSKRLGVRGALRVDLVHRDFQDFYSQRTDLSTGQVTTANGTSDLTLIENSNRGLERRYDALETQFRYRLGDHLDLGGNWTVSKTRGNLDGETTASGPVNATVHNYPEYIRAEWNSPSGPLAIDQRHRASLYGTWTSRFGGRHEVSVGLLQSFFSGLPYQAVATINPRPFVTNPGYVIPPASVNYYFSKRGAFTTDNVFRTDVSFNYSIKLGPVEAFVRPEIINVFNGQHIDTTSVQFDSTVLTSNNAGRCSQAGAGGTPGPCQAFNPFTQTPVEHVNWEKGPNFGKATGPNAYQLPRTYRIGIGLRF